MVGAIDSIARGRFGEPPLPIQREADLQGHLPVRDASLLEIAARFGNLEPAHVADGFLCPGKRVLNSVFHSVRRRTDQLNLFVNMIAHRFNLPFPKREYNNV